MPRANILPKPKTNSSTSSEIRNFVSKRRPTLLGVTKLMKQINQLVVPAADTKIGFEEAKKAYSAEKIDNFIKEGKIPIPYQRGQAIWGCYQQSKILYYSMKALGFKPRMFKEVISPGVVHTSLWFRRNGQLYEADPFYRAKVYKVDPVRKEQAKQQMKLGRFSFIKPEGYTFEMYKKERKENKILGEKLNYLKGE